MGATRRKYEILRDEWQGDPGSVTGKQEDRAARRVRASWAFTVPATALLGVGVDLLVVGLRSKRANMRLRAHTGPGGLRRDR